MNTRPVERVWEREKECVRESERGRPARAWSRHVRERVCVSESECVWGFRIEVCIGFRVEWVGFGIHTR